MRDSDLIPSVVEYGECTIGQQKERNFEGSHRGVKGRKQSVDKRRGDCARVKVTGR